MVAYQVQFTGREQALEEFFLSDHICGVWSGRTTSERPVGKSDGSVGGFDSRKQRNLIRLSAM